MFRFIKKVIVVCLFAFLTVAFLSTLEDEEELLLSEAEQGQELILDSRTSSRQHKTIHLAKFFNDKNITKHGIFPLPKISNNIPVQRPENSVIPTRFYQEDFKRTHDYNYIINEEFFCTDHDEVFLLVNIASAVWEFKRREIIRKTWMDYQKSEATENLVVKFLFFVATGTERAKQLAPVLKDESNAYHDIVHENFDETYKNLTLKTLGQLKWTTYFCPNAKYVMHVDDDVYTAVPDLINYAIKVDHMAPKVNERNPIQNFDPQYMIYCAKVFMPVVRREGKWEMSFEDYPDKQYPLGCVGWCFMMPFRVVKDLYYMSLETPYIHLEDVTVTGILREKIGITKVMKMDGNEQYCKHLGWPKDLPVEEKLRIEHQKYYGGA